MKILLRIIHNYNKTEKDSTWKSLKDAVDVILKIILIIIAITPLVSIYIVSSYLDSFHASIIGFSIFSNIANLGLIIIYSFSFFASYLLVIFALPAFYGYLYDEDLPYYDINNLCKSKCNNFKEKICRVNKALIIFFAVILSFIVYLLYRQLIIYKLIVIYLAINLLFILIIPPIKEDKKFKWYGIFWLVFANITPFLFLFFIFRMHKHISLLSVILTIIYGFFIFIFGILYANTKKNKTKKNNVFDIIYIIATIIIIFFIFTFFYIRIPFSQIAMSSSGLGNKNVIFKLKPNTPSYLKKLLTNKDNPYQTKKLFLLIQTSKNYYVEKLNTIKLSKSFTKRRKTNYTMIIPPSYAVYNKNKHCYIVKLPLGYVYIVNNKRNIANSKTNISLHYIMPQNIIKYKAYSLEIPEKYVIKYKAYYIIEIPEKYVIINQNKPYYTYINKTKNDYIKLPKKYVLNIITDLSLQQIKKS